MLDLTAQEKKVLIALGALAVLGLAVLAYKTYIARPRVTLVPGAGRQAEVKPALVNINTADAGEIASLPGIGEKTAKQIIDYRSERGQFILKEDLMKVGGIGPKTFGKIKDLIVLE